MYKSLNDAAVTNPILAAGTTKIWYAKSHRDVGMGYEWCEEHGYLPKLENITTEYELLGSIVGRDMYQIVIALQGENWSPSPNFPARDMLRGRDINTTISCGDIIEIDGKFYFVDPRLGFPELK